MPVNSLLKKILKSIFTIYTAAILILSAIGLVLFYYRLSEHEFPREKKLALVFGILDIVMGAAVLIGSAMID